MRTAPVQGFSAGIPWSLHLRAWDGYSAKWGRGQTAERLAERGGFHTGELDEFVPGWRQEVSEIARLRAAHQEIVRKYERIMQGPPEWTSFAPDDPRLQFAREAWFGAAQISRKALNDEQKLDSTSRAHIAFGDKIIGESEE